MTEQQCGEYGRRICYTMVQKAASQATVGRKGATYFISSATTC